MDRWSSRVLGMRIYDKEECIGGCHMKRDSEVKKWIKQARAFDLGLRRIIVYRGPIRGLLWALQLALEEAGRQHGQVESVKAG